MELTSVKFQLSPLSQKKFAWTRQYQPIPTTRSHHHIVTSGMSGACRVSGPVFQLRSASLPSPVSSEYWWFGKALELVRWRMLDDRPSSAKLHFSLKLSYYTGMDSNASNGTRDADSANKPTAPVVDFGLCGSSILRCVNCSAGISRSYLHYSIPDH